MHGKSLRYKKLTFTVRHWGIVEYKSRGGGGGEGQRSTMVGILFCYMSTHAKADLKREKEPGLHGT